MNWLQAKAHADCWLEEHTLVKHEMQWTILWFQYQANLWGEDAKMEDANLPIGHKAYAAKQSKLWNVFQKKASERFTLYM